MDIFELNKRVIADYKGFSRSFTLIDADDLRNTVDHAYESGRYTPEALISMNPHYEAGRNVAELASDKLIDADTASVFSINGTPIILHKHQQEAAAKALAGESFVVTTGTGSGKSLCFFLPIVDQAIRARKAGKAPRTRAVIVYPMNALANSQQEEIDKFIRGANLKNPPTVRRYTGQESMAERQAVADNPPDILLTNFVMLELLMTRGDDVGCRVIENCRGLDWLVLDELHTYRGRQGADVAMLVRRMREALSVTPEQSFDCIGTSATMATGDEGVDEKATVARVATKLFATPLDQSSVIVESLMRATAGEPDTATLASAMDAPDLKVPDDQLKSHPLVIWAETQIGLDDSEGLKRRKPMRLEEAVMQLAKDSGASPDLCGKALTETLLACSLPQSARGGKGDRAFLAFKLHQFVSGPESIHATLAPRGLRRMTLEKQLYHPDNDALLFETRFCRVCGQDYHPVRFDGECLSPRAIDDEAKDEEDVALGFATVRHDAMTFDDHDEDYPESWQEEGKDGAMRLRSNRRKQRAQRLDVNESGRAGALDGQVTSVWYLPGRFAHCICCNDTPAPQSRDINKLAGLSAEGRSSATTMITTDILKVEADLGQPEEKRKLLVFTDNRQDAALQAGHFNDSIFISKLRAGFLAALRDAGEDGLNDETLGSAIAKALGYVHTRPEGRSDWMLNPAAKGAGPGNAERAIRDVLAHRAWADQRRGWRFTNPSLEELGLIDATYPYIDDLAADLEEMVGAPDVVLEAPLEKRREALLALLDTMRRGLAVDTEALHLGQIDQIAKSSRGHLCAPWAFDEKEDARGATWLLIDPLPYKGRKPSDEKLLLRGGPQSKIGRTLSERSLWGRKLDRKEYAVTVAAFLNALKVYDIVTEDNTPFGPSGWRIKRSGIVFHAGDGTRDDGRPVNAFFQKLYRDLAESLERQEPILTGVEAREHTAQVSKETRQHRERRFRFKENDIEEMSEETSKQEGRTRLPIMICSPTMELGVDISALDTVFLRNVPPTPANYTQRAGRAGRAGQAALIQTYCAAQSPHDRYYFDDPARIVNGIVRAPMLDLENVDLVTAHLHAVWLSTAAIELKPAIAEVLDLGKDGYPVAGYVAEALDSTSLASFAVPRMEGVLDQLGVDREQFDAAFVRDVATGAYRRFDEAFRSWRARLQAAEVQRDRAHLTSSSHGVSRTEKRAAEIAYDSARRQIMLLTTGKENQSSDFFTYRYLATEGFLPGYNFPRLPLTAFVPGKRGEKGGGGYLSRARFLAIAEFGPMSLIYHEGQAYRVVRAMLPPGARDEGGVTLNTEILKICTGCGALQSGTAPESCEACDASMGDFDEIKSAFRIENVETAPAERISANDEDRQKQGFDIQTAFSWGQRDRLVRVALRDEDGGVAEFTYGPSTKIVRINKGLRRRADREVLGYNIEVQSGRWAGSVNKPGEDDPENPLTGAKTRIVPMVEENKNALLLRIDQTLLPSDEADAKTTLATLQSALARGIEIVFQLEEGEIAVEPMPNRDERRALLIYEAAEGGAGVLARFGSRIPEVAVAALERMHRVLDGDGWIEKDPPCVAGCYQCLLSYFNQTEHVHIDRQDERAIAILTRFTKASVVPQVGTEKDVAGGEGLTPWGRACASWGLIPPDMEPFEQGSETTLAIWRDQSVAVVCDPTSALGVFLEGQGYSVVAGSANPPNALPKTLSDLLPSDSGDPA